MEEGMGARDEVKQGREAEVNRGGKGGRLGILALRLGSHVYLCHANFWRDYSIYSSQAFAAP